MGNDLKEIEETLKDFDYESRFESIRERIRKLGRMPKNKNSFGGIDDEDEVIKAMIVKLEILYLIPKEHICEKCLVRIPCFEKLGIDINGFDGINDLRLGARTGSRSDCALFKEDNRMRHSEFYSKLVPEGIDPGEYK